VLVASAKTRRGIVEEVIVITMAVHDEPHPISMLHVSMSICIYMLFGSLNVN
jgi:hypothetical protein